MVLADVPVGECVRTSPADGQSTSRLKDGLSYRIVAGGSSDGVILKARTETVYLSQNAADGLQVVVENRHLLSRMFF